MEQEAYMIQQAQRCEKLWEAVLAQAIRDLTSCPSRAKDQIIRTRTVRWFNKNNSGFVSVCYLAGRMPDQILKAVRSKLDEH